MRLQTILASAAVLLTIPMGDALAVGTLIAAPNRADMVHDMQRGRVYVTDGGNVLRYDVASGAFLDPVTVGGRLGGVDLSPDGTTLAVADRASTASEVWVHLIRLDDLSVTRLTVPKAFYEDGTWAAAFAADGGLFVTSRFAGSGWVPMRRFDIVSGRWTEVTSVTQDTMVTASGNGQAIGFAEANISDGRWGRYDVPTGELMRRQYYESSTGWFNFEIGANATGSQFAIPTYGGTFIYDQGYSRLATIGQYAGPQPIGVAYHPVEDLVYFPWAQSGEVRVFDTRSYAQIDSFDFEDSFQHTGNQAFQQGRTRLSRDGSLLMVSVTGGVRILRMYEPLAAAPVAASTTSGVPVTLALGGSIGNGGQLAYSVAKPPVNGSVSIDGAQATYTPKSGFSGSDSFTYRVAYGQATVEADAVIAVLNGPPVAVDDMAQTKRNTPVAIAVLANDQDPDGDALTLAATTAPPVGSVAVSGSSIVYTPPRNYVGTTSFTYTVTDGNGGTARAKVTVSTTKR